MIPKVAPWKRSTVSDLESMLGSEGVLAVVDVHGIPASAMLSMRDGLRSDMRIRVAKKRLMRLAWENAGRDLDELEALLEGTVQPALVHSMTMDSFQIFRRLKETEEGRAAKPGDVAPFDIVIEKMDTGMPPGPIVGELNSVGIPAKIMGGSVQIQKRTVVLEEGEVFEGDLGMLLGQIGVKPIVTGLKLNGPLEEGVRFGPSSLDIDYDAFESSLIAQAAGAFNLACHIGWFTPATTPTLVAKAAGEALAVAIQASVTNSTTMPHLIARAHGSVLAVAGQLDSSALDDELANLLGQQAAAAAAVVETPTEAPTEAPEEEEDEEDEDAGFDGLGDLFG